jgi:hypothetical protein
MLAKSFEVPMCAVLSSDMLTVQKGLVRAGSGPARKSKAVSGKGENEMKQRNILWVVLGFVVLVLAFGVVTWASTNRSEVTADAPAEVAEAFYQWYTDYARPDEAGEIRNPMTDGAYRDSEFLAPVFVEQVDDILSAREMGGGDPFLCAQDVPMRYQVGEAEIRGDGATVPVTTFWTGNPMASRFMVELGQIEGRWMITHVTCTGEPVPLTAEQTVTAFYDLYLEASQRRNLLGDGGYRHLPFLAPEFVAKVEGLEPFMYDPFLCAQDIPVEVMVGKAEIVNGVARVEVTTSFAEHGFVVELTEGEMGWQIVDVICR